MKARKERGGQEKRPYAKPSLTSYGSITELTRTAAGNCRDNVNAFNNAQLTCLKS